MTDARDEFEASGGETISSYAQASLPDESGVVKVRRVRLTATTVAGAAAELRRLMNRREEEQLPLMTQAPKFDEYAEKYIETQ